MPEEFGKDYWEERYGGHDAAHRKEPNPQLLAEAGDLDPGKALDAGCGEGADATWLALHGWQVTAVDISGRALERARGLAEGLGAEVAGRIDWAEADLTTWAPPENHFDLVSSHYVHPAGSRQLLFRRLAAAVAPGGTLLVVGHDVSDTHHSGSHTPSPESAIAVGEVVDALDPDAWEVLVAETRSRSANDAHGSAMTMRDAVVRARKRS